MNPEDRISLALQVDRLLMANIPADLEGAGAESERSWIASVLSIVLAAHSTKGDATFVLPK
jgi:hypothetical protein